jgi:hypothetical protein
MMMMTTNTTSHNPSYQRVLPYVMFRAVVTLEELVIIMHDVLQMIHRPAKARKSAGTRPLKFRSQCSPAYKRRNTKLYQDAATFVYQSCI